MSFGNNKQENNILGKVSMICWGLTGILQFILELPNYCVEAANFFIYLGLPNKLLSNWSNEISDLAMMLRKPIYTIPINGYSLSVKAYNFLFRAISLDNYMIVLKLGLVITITISSLCIAKLFCKKSNKVTDLLRNNSVGFILAGMAITIYIIPGIFAVVAAIIDYHATSKEKAKPKEITRDNNYLDSQAVIQTQNMNKITEQLQKLSELRAKGLLTEEEFNNEKSKLLR